MFSSNFIKNYLFLWVFMKIASKVSYNDWIHVSVFFLSFCSIILISILSLYQSYLFFISSVFFFNFGLNCWQILIVHYLVLLIFILLQLNSRYNYFFWELMKIIEERWLGNIILLIKIVVEVETLGKLRNWNPISIMFCHENTN
jgi:hypothetical protein